MKQRAKEKRKLYLSIVVMIALMLTMARERLLHSRMTKMGMSEK
jgi:hypothetical protein